MKRYRYSLRSAHFSAAEFKKAAHVFRRGPQSGYNRSRSAGLTDFLYQRDRDYRIGGPIQMGRQRRKSLWRWWPICAEPLSGICHKANSLPRADETNKNLESADQAALGLKPQRSSKCSVRLFRSITTRLEYASAKKGPVPASRFRSGI
jgi:hypothetical protein